MASRALRASIPRRRHLARLVPVLRHREALAEAPTEDHSVGTHVAEDLPMAAVSVALCILCSTALTASTVSARPAKLTPTAFLDRARAAASVHLEEAEVENYGCQRENTTFECLISPALYGGLCPRPGRKVALRLTSKSYLSRQQFAKPS